MRLPFFLTRPNNLFFTQRIAHKLEESNLELEGVKIDLASFFNPFFSVTLRKVYMALKSVQDLWIEHTWRCKAYLTFRQSTHGAVGY